MTAATPTAVDTARSYYNSNDAEEFYSSIWGGEDIHIGLYESEAEPIFEASRRTVEKLAALAGTLDPNTKVLDIGSGYCGAARFLAKKFGCKVVAVNLSEVENERARALNTEQGLADRIEVIDGSFEKLPFDEGSFDVVWSQDAILHSSKRAQVLAEVARVLKPGGRFVFTDPMQSDECPAGVLAPVLARIHLESLGSPKFYRDAASKCGLVEDDFIQHTDQLVNHYSRVLQETEKRTSELTARVSPEYIERMKQGLGHWIEGGKKGHLAWGLFRFHKA